MRVRRPFGHESAPDVRILATQCPAAKRLQKQLPDTLRPWLRPILETVLPGLNKQQNPRATSASIDHTGLKNHKKLRVRKL